MLVLSRKAFETIHIGNDIVIQLLRTGSVTRIGITAPKNVEIMRGELLNTQCRQGTETPVVISSGAEAD